jgi:hypothetical protein
MKNEAVRIRPIKRSSTANSGYKESDIGLYKGTPASPCIPTKIV